MQMQVQGFHDPETGTVSYVVHEQGGTAAAVIDPVLDYDPKSGRTSTAHADELIDYVLRHGLSVQWLLETHAHADHLSAAGYLKRVLGGRIGIGAQIGAVQRVFKRLYNLGPGFPCDGSQFDHLFQDGERFHIGALEGEAIAVPGHTPADMAYRIGDAVFVGDTLFMPDVGTARADFPGGDARQLYRSIRRLLALPEATRLYVCHDYPPAGRGPQWETTVGEQRAHNIHVRDGIGEDEFVAMRTARDRTLDMPTLMLPAIQVNVRAGELPPPEPNGIAYLKIPLNAL
ncbi:MBL fold metallo-hydrolase [Caldimonas thermodepolymerans]|uniref:MBL fold metallo-hydrolase n=1 Tax=Caldimonas thermodepolymerans TaxID=215580 RepID=UPI00223615A6|nr:MBL fold metallo-hydrolase [Caldimonas thermodepolymerans]UZG44874.1 MBL fold metallo-hydrolase [Caldimonas thermodepolymerans]